MHTDRFIKRHIGPQGAERDNMMETVGVAHLDELIREAVPASIRLSQPVSVPPALSEHGFLEEIQEIAGQNQIFKNYIGLGYYDCITPAVIRRNIFENPGWYTQYTPYQSEISQGRLEALFHFQTVVVELTGLDLANASLLDEATAAAEAMTMLYRLRSREAVSSGAGATTFFVSRNCFPQTIEVLRMRAEPLGIELEVGDEALFSADSRYYGILLQYPDANGSVKNYRDLIGRARAASIPVVLAADLLALSLLESPGSLGADVAIGTSQRFGVPMGYGGPHAAYFAVRKDYQRSIPGRLVGLSMDRLNQEGYRLALQTREQHIRREKATSNICTAQALLAIMAAMYAIYHGPEGLKQIALEIHSHAQLLEAGLKEIGFDQQRNEYYFDTLHIDLGKLSQEKLRQLAEKNGINLRYFADQGVGISLDETTSQKDIARLIEIFGQASQAQTESARQVISQQASVACRFPAELLRKDTFLSQEVFHYYHSETAMMRYIRRLEGMDLALNQIMIPLGSCTMKLNPAAAMIPVSLAAFARLHPFAPCKQSQGYLYIFRELEKYLAEITGMDAVSLQPNSGAQGEFSGLMVIRAYHRDRGEEQRDIALIPASAHGTNPSSAIMAGMKVVIVGCDRSGGIDIEDLRQKVIRLREHLACIMITYPSTYGVFEETIQEVCRLVHESGGLVYLDGANMNAQVGLCNPRKVGADVCHLNLHKTFSIPHGGGGPGMGPICVVSELKPYLPDHCLVSQTGGPKAIGAVSAAPWGSASILLISYAYVRLLGADGMEAATKYAILSANYIKKRLEGVYEILYSNPKGRVAHEMVLDLRGFRKYGIEVEDVAKRLIDYGFHAPTMSWPVPGTLMVEPTESEPKGELDRFCDAMLKIREEMEAIINGEADPNDNVLKNAPHPAQELVHDQWEHSYSREKAAYPLRNAFKFWPPLARIDNVYGDRNLVCSCPPVAAYSSSGEKGEPIYRDKKAIAATV